MRTKALKSYHIFPGLASASQTEGAKEGEGEYGTDRDNDHHRQLTLAGCFSTELCERTPWRWADYRTKNTGAD